jgi:hypothetical protein
MRKRIENLKWKVLKFSYSVLGTSLLLFAFVVHPYAFGLALWMTALGLTVVASVVK